MKKQTGVENLFKQLKMLLFTNKTLCISYYFSFLNVKKSKTLQKNKHNWGFRLRQIYFLKNLKKVYKSHKNLFTLSPSQWSLSASALNISGSLELLSVFSTSRNFSQQLFSLLIFWYCFSTIASSLFTDLSRLRLWLSSPAHVCLLPLLSQKY